MSVNKDALTTNIRAWIALDKEMNTLQKELKERRKRKADLSRVLIEIMRKNEIDCVDINDGKLVCSKHNTKSTLNKKKLVDVLGKYFANKVNVPTEEIAQFILDSRDVKTKDELRLKTVRKV